MNKTVEITEKSDFTDILDALRSAGLGGVARRIMQLDNLIQNNSAENPIDIKSLQKFTQFLLKNRNLLRPAISTSREGYIHAEWQSGLKDIAVMIFLPSGLIRFTTVVDAEWKDGTNLNIMGTLPPEMMLKSLKEFKYMFTKKRIIAFLKKINTMIEQ